MPTMQVNGVTLAYEDSGAPPGRPDAPTIVFGHGLLFSGRMFHEQVAALKDRYRCITIDWRGQGETPATSGGYDMDTLTADAVGLIEALGVAPVHYVGLSMGGFVGQRIGARHRELLRSLTLLDTSPDREDPAAARQDKILGLAYRVLGMKPLLGKVKPIMFGPNFLADPRSQAVIEEWMVRLGRCDRAGVHKAVLGVATRDAICDEIGSISVPTLVVVGAQDSPTPPDKAKRIAAKIPGARLEIVAESGHSSTVEQPARLTALIEGFVTAVDA